ncbi:hypothetical protein [Streptomyces sp. GQFP]|uniref:hypothetical protein n=1 Tax=Streptomyces sp. GQFP TaxID=2907545 RepID=UPI001F4914A3|nr:hypothetical protein [Streptomyces sp. GQFP]UIX29541.1 hypothetical protein LUX31_05545 [Streptomyces sp. GQFP]
MSAPPPQAPGGQAGPPGSPVFAVAVVGAVRGCTEWAGPWRERLTALRRHPEADVRDAALDEVMAYG